jgi:hypothetical protein
MCPAEAAADKSFFQLLAISVGKIHRIRGEEAAEFPARQAEAEISAALRRSITMDNRWST